MRRHGWIAAVLLALVAGGRCVAQEPCGLTRFAPAGGWFPYPGGLLHWWCPDWFRSGLWQ
jgi:hypothetical protein